MTKSQAVVFSSPDHAALWLLGFVCGGLSVLGIAFVVFLVWAWRKWRRR